MIKVFDLLDEKFYEGLPEDFREEFDIIPDAIKGNLTPVVTIISTGHPSSWYNKHQGKSYVLYKFIIDTDNGYINYLVRSGKDGTAKGYKPWYYDRGFGQGYDIVHSIAGRIDIAFTEKNLQKAKSTETNSSSPE